MIFKELKDKDFKEDFSYKVIVIGNSGVGKSNFILRIQGKEFLSDSTTTIGVELFSKNYEITHTEDGKEVKNKIKVNIWDTAGQERYKSVTTSYYKGAKGVFVLYDLTKKDTFNSVDDWIQDVKMNCNTFPSIMIVGTKSDLYSLKSVSDFEQKKKAEKHGNIFFTIDAFYVEVSSKEDNNVNTAFINLISEMHWNNLNKNEYKVLDTGFNIKEKQSLSFSCCSK